MKICLKIAEGLKLRVKIESQNYESMGKISYWLKILLSLFSLTASYQLLTTPVFAAKTLSFIHSDHLGSTSLITDEQGNVVSQQVYYPYGSTRSKLTADARLPAGQGLQPTAREYTGQVSDQAETDLYYYNARYYDISTNLFISTDKKNGVNHYVYTLNNPLRYTDRTGEQQENATPAIDDEVNRDYVKHPNNYFSSGGQTNNVKMQGVDEISTSYPGLGSVISQNLSPSFAKDGYLVN